MCQTIDTNQYKCKIKLNTLKRVSTINPSDYRHIIDGRRNFHLKRLSFAESDFILPRIQAIHCWIWLNSFSQRYRFFLSFSLWKFDFQFLQYYICSTNRVQKKKSINPERMLNKLGTQSGKLWVRCELLVNKIV